MENHRVFCCSAGIILLLSAFAAAEDPLRNVNLSPFWQWRSAYDCMQNVSASCTKKDITIAGVVDVNQTEVANYCNGGCAEHTKQVLYCISLVHRNFWFANKLTTWDLNKTISDGCTQNKAFSTAGITSGGVKNYRNLLTSLVFSVPTLFVVTIFKI